MAKIMVVGPAGAGKTSLIRTLQGIAGKVEKTQTIHFCGGAIDSPGEYAQIPRFYSALLVTSMEAATILLLKDATERTVSLPPGFAGMFARPVYGVVTKVDLPQTDRDRATTHLLQAGIKSPVFFVSVVTGEGVRELYQFLTTRGCKL